MVGEIVVEKNMVSPTVVIGDINEFDVFGTLVE
jgi:hypothetical protein